MRRGVLTIQKIRRENFDQQDLSKILEKQFYKIPKKVGSHRTNKEGKNESDSTIHRNK